MSSPLTRTVFVAVLLLLSGCSAQPELDFADWIFPVPEGTPLKEYAPTPLDERTEIAFELVEDLVIGGDPADPNTAFYTPRAVVAAENGNIFVVEAGGARVQMFGPDGDFLKTLGKKGQGPGEFQAPGAATIAGNRLIVFDTMGFRLSVWTDEGEFVANHAIPMSSVPIRVAGLPDGRVMAIAVEMDLSSINGSLPASGMPSITTVIASYSSEGERLERLVGAANPPLPTPGELGDARGRLQYSINSGNYPRPGFAVGLGQVVYVTPSSEYQILAMTPEGETHWALRVAWPRRSVSESSKERRVRAFARDDPEIDVDDFDWPEFDNAISGTLRSDGQGRLYVFPFAQRDESEDASENEGTNEEPRGRPVDVYSPDGELIVAGLASGSWSYARGDYVYRLRSDPETDETQVIRYRLVVNPE